MCDLIYLDDLVVGLDCTSCLLVAVIHIPKELAPELWNAHEGVRNEMRSDVLICSDGPEFLDL